MSTPTHQPPSGNSQKTAKSAISHLVSHTLQPTPRRSSRLRIPIRAMFPYVSADPPYNRQALKIPTLVSTRPAFPAPQTRHPQASTNSLRRLPARCRMSGRGIKSAETSDRLAQIYAPDRLTQIHCANEGGMGTASLRDATTPTTVGAAPACMIGPKGGLTVRLEA